MKRGWKTGLRAKTHGKRKAIVATETLHFENARFAQQLFNHEPRNLQALCPSCHTKKTRIECGHRPPSDERQQWQDFVADLAGKATTPKPKPSMFGEHNA